jgi:hypothetical protein
MIDLLVHQVRLDTDYHLVITSPPAEARLPAEGIGKVEHESDSGQDSVHWTELCDCLRDSYLAIQLNFVANSGQVVVEVVMTQP